MRARMGGLRGLGVISEALLSETLPSETLTPKAESRKPKARIKSTFHPDHGSLYPVP